MCPKLFSPASIDDISLSWDILHKHWGKSNFENLPLYFDPHIGLDDLHSKTTSEQMAALHPAFSWWAGNNFTASSSDKHTSMNLVDVVTSNLSNTPVSHGLNKSLWSELIGRYMKHRSVEDHVLSQLDIGEQENQTVSISTKSNRISPQTLIQAEFA